MPIRELALSDIIHYLFELNLVLHCIHDLEGEKFQLACNRLFLFLSILLPFPVQSKTADGSEQVMLRVVPGCHEFVELVLGETLSLHDSLVDG